MFLHGRSSRWQRRHLRKAFGGKVFKQVCRGYAWNKACYNGNQSSMKLLKSQLPGMMGMCRVGKSKRLGSTRIWSRTGQTGRHLRPFKCVAVWASVYVVWHVHFDFHCRGFFLHIVEKQVQVDISKLQKEHAREVSKMKQLFHTHASLFDLRVCVELGARSRSSKPQIRTQISGPWLNKTSR